MVDKYEEIRKGVSLIWNNQFEEADALLEVKKDTSPRYALHHAESVFLRSFITADVSDTQAALDRLKGARDLAEKHIALYEKGFLPGSEPPQKGDPTEILKHLVDARLVVGDSLYMTAILQMTRDAKIKGSWKVFEKALRESKSIPDFDNDLKRSLEFGAGFFMFAISIIPPKFLKLVELAGFKADRDGGLSFIRECHKDGGFREPFATMILLVNDLLLPRGIANVDAFLKDADELLEVALKKYPKGSLFHVMASHCARKQCNIAKGIEMMEIALDNSKHFKQPPLIYRYELANCYAMELGWKKALPLYEPLIQEKQFQVRCICAIQSAACYVMLSEPAKAEALFKALPTYAGKSSLDATVVRMGKRYLSSGGHFAAFELLYLRRDLAKMLPIMDQVLRSLDEMVRTFISSSPQALRTKAMQKIEITPEMRKNTGALGKFSTSFKNLSPFAKKKDAPSGNPFDDRASYLLLRVSHPFVRFVSSQMDSNKQGSILKSLNRVDEAMECYREVVDDLAEFVTEKLYVPYCLYELGESHYQSGKLKEAEELMKRCGKLSGYDWEDPLKIRLRVTMDQLKKGTQPAPPQVLSLDSFVTAESPDEVEPVEPDSDEEEK